MADTPEDAVALSDADLDDIVNDLNEEAGVSVGADTEEGSQESTAAGDETQSETETSGETELGAQVEEEAGATASETTQEESAATTAETLSATGSQPFEFTGAGQKHVLPGATELADGTVRIGKEGAARLRQTLASAVGIQSEWKEERKKLHRELAAATESKSDREVEADHIVSLFERLHAMTPEERYEWAANFTANTPKLEVEIEKAKLQRDRQRWERERSGAPQSEVEVQEQVQETLTQELASTFRRLIASPEAANLTAEDKRQLWDKWSKKPDRLVVRATRDMPDIGVKAGEFYFDDEDVADDFRTRAKLRGEVKPILSAANRNAQANADLKRRGNAIPPAVTSRQPAGDVKAKPKKLKGKEFEKAFMKGQLDDKD